MGGKVSYVLLSAALLAAALAAGVATWLEWLPCRGSMLNGSILAGYQYPFEFSDACLMRMDGDPAIPLTAGTLEARALSAMLLSLGWLGFAIRLRLAPVLRAIALLPILPTGWFAVQTLLSRDIARPIQIGTAMNLIELAAFAAAVVISTRMAAADEDRLPSLIGLWAVASYGVLHFVGDYLLMTFLSDANWDTPPGTGYATVVIMAACGVFVAIRGSRNRASLAPSVTASTAPATPLAR